ncbi:CHY zinc finger domain protein [Aspergillus heteromorphus CBS 117.55]|uniref:CHY zinc finger domain protein n=1 Tax=Aspergillus heteromorphus CBS 117.55 TaxID=1448321 RepID=A0A317VXB7_9EURO|nr:CHY zinc finger domain protein [Aspergillus heteromorphus CBS 117.55]PWY78269.1 CHY zinc finger domain protein [Aspergillus heteromorphus CBS 117.55]
MSNTHTGSSANAGSAAGQRPISKAEATDPREFQLNQLRRRFHPTETSNEAGTTLTFGLAPSDPDFPFEMDKLQCILQVPRTYPAQGRPSIRVTNAEMGSAFQENIARGFDDIVDSTIRTGGRGTLLSWTNALDRHLERLLTTTERGPILKFVPNVGSKEPEEQKLAQSLNALAVSSERKQPVAPKPRVFQPPAPVFTREEKAQAEKRRALETKQLEARLGRLPFFQKSGDGLFFVIPIQPPKPDRLPIPLRSIKTVKLRVPTLYPLEPSVIELQGVAGKEAEAVQAGFSQWLEGNKQMNLVSQVNYLTSNMHNFAKTPLKAPEPTPAPEPSVTELPITQIIREPEPTPAPTTALEDKPHVHVVPRPPEWTAGEHSSGSEESEFTASEDEPTDGDEEEDGGTPVPDLPETSTADRGVALSFPFLELYGIELLELVGLYITVKCDRCKEHLDVKNIPQIKDKSDELAPKIETCKKCTNTMSLGFRRQLMHPSATRAGYLDLDGCTVVDLLPSNFIPTCAECSTPFPGPGVVAVRGESAMANCRQCHRKMVFKIPEVKFLKVGSAAFSSRFRAPPRKKPKEILGIVAGQELPRRGRCTHYAKSYRWFRFSCCAKVFPCDKYEPTPSPPLSPTASHIPTMKQTNTHLNRCHDAAEDHPNEHANRMICGYCSREQIYRPENCGVCRAVLIGKAGSGFWEGGKGTRNRTLMSRKDVDPRKYKRRGGSVVGSKK